MSKALEKMPSKKQMATLMDQMFRKNAPALMEAFFEQLLVQVSNGNQLAMQQLERIYKLSQQSPTVAVQINNNNTVNSGRSGGMSFERIVGMMDDREKVRSKSETIEAEVVNAG